MVRMLSSEDFTTMTKMYLESMENKSRPIYYLKKKTLQLFNEDELLSAQYLYTSI
jgi:hypothetical protein